MYCGDETGAFIGDIGSTTSRFGYGGEDCPKLVVPSYLSHDYKSFPSSTTKKQKSYDNDIVPIYHQPSINEEYNTNNRNNNISIDPIHHINDGIISSFDAWENIWMHSFSQLSISKSSSSSNNDSTSTTNDSKCLHPLFAVDSGNTHHYCSSELYSTNVLRKQRETMVEIMFEKFGAPAVFIAPAPMVQAFSMGRQTGLIVDMGGAGCRATPIVDGLILKQTQRRNGLGGDWLSAMQLKLLENSQINVKPRYNIIKSSNATKTSLVEEDLQRNKRNYFHEFSMREIMYEMKTSSHVKLSLENNNSNHNNHIMDIIDDGDDDSALSRNLYQLPDGTNIDLNNPSYGKEIIQLPNLLFSLNPFQDINITPPTSITSPPPTNNLPQTLIPNIPLPKLIHDSISSCDADLRKELCNNILLTGSHSLYNNLDKRLSVELSNLCSSSYKVRVIASKNSIERKFASWIGSSVLTSLGSFQQLWLGKTEYEEYGVLLSCNRFP